MDRPRIPRRRDERGAILPLTVMMLSTTLLLASLVIDLGGGRVVRRDMQSVADVVALDLARELDGSTAAGGFAGFNASGYSSTLLAAARDASLARQGGLVVGSNPAVSVRLGVADTSTGRFDHWAASGEIPNAVGVRVAGSYQFRLLPVAQAPADKIKTTQRTAIAVNGQPLVCVSAGAALADLQPNSTLDLLLGRLIGIDRLTLVSPHGLAALSATVPLGGLATQLGLGRVEDLATASVTGRAFLQAAATVLSNKGDTAAADILNAIAVRVNGTTNINIPSILTLNTGKGSALGLSQEAFGLAQAVIEVSNMNNFVDIGVPNGVTGLVPLTFKAKIIQAPQIACGGVGTRAHSSQIQLSLTANVTQLAAGVASTKINPLEMTFGDGWAEVTEVTCTPGVTRIRMAADTAVGLYRMHLDIGLIGGLSALDVWAPKGGGGNPPKYEEIGKSHTNPLTFVFNEGSTDIPPSQTAGNALQNFGMQNTSTDVKVIGLPISGGTNSLVNSVLGGVDGHLNSILNPVLTELGLRLGTVEIRPTSRPSCTQLSLRQ